MLIDNETIKRIDLSGIVRATVINNVDDRGGEGRIAVCISKVMPVEDELGDPVKPKTEDTLDKSMIENDSDNPYKTKIQIVNHYWVRPCYLLDKSPSERTVTNELVKDGGHQDATIGGDLKETRYIPMTGEYRVPRIGTEVYIFFEDKDPQKGFYLPFSPTLDGEVTPMDEVEKKDNVENLSKKANIQVLREFQNGTVIYADTNDDTNTFTIKMQDPNYDRHLGHRIKFEHNADHSSIVIDTAYGHQIKMVDKSTNDGSNNERDNNDEDGVNKGKFITVSTPKGHKVILDDNDGFEKIQLTSSIGHNILMDDVDHRIIAKTYTGHFIDMHDDQDHIKIHTKSGSIIDMLSGTNIIAQSARIDLNP